MKKIDLINKLLCFIGWHSFKFSIQDCIEECKKSERNESIEFASWLLQQDITSRGDGKYVTDRGEIVTVSDLYNKFKNH